MVWLLQLVLALRLSWVLPALLLLSLLLLLLLLCQAVHQGIQVQPQPLHAIVHHVCKVRPTVASQVIIQQP